MTALLGVVTQQSQTHTAQMEQPAGKVDLLATPPERLTEVNASTDDGMDGVAKQDAAGETPSPRLATVLTRLINTVHPSGRGPYTLDEISAGIRDQSGVLITPAYLSQLATGARNNLTMERIQAIAAFFGVPAGIFFDPTQAAAVEEELALLRAIRDGGVRDIALRAAELPPGTREALRLIIDELVREHGTQHPGRRRGVRNPDASNNS